MHSHSSCNSHKVIVRVCVLYLEPSAQVCSWQWGWSVSSDDLEYSQWLLLCGGDGVRCGHSLCFLTGDLSLWILLFPGGVSLTLRSVVLRLSWHSSTYLDDPWVLSRKFSLRENSLDLRLTSNRVSFNPGQEEQGSSAYSACPATCRSSLLCSKSLYITLFE